MENSALLSLLHKTAEGTGSAKRGKVSSRGGGGGGGGVRGFLRLFKLFPLLTSGCKMVALLGRARSRSSRPAAPQLLRDKATTGTLFGYRKGRLILAVQEDPYQLPMFIMELPLLTTTFHKELMASTDDLIINIRIGLESETKSHKKNLMEEFVWAVYCNGRKIGYSIRRRNQLITEDELYVMQLLRGVSMGAGVLPPPNCPPTPTPPSSTSDQLRGEEESDHDQLTYIRARFDRIIGSKDSEALYMINPDGDGATGLDLSIFFLRPQHASS